jgi:hypothetical protein
VVGRGLVLLLIVWSMLLLMLLHLLWLLVSSVAISNLKKTVTKKK